MTYDVGAFNSNFMFEREDHKSKVAYADGSVKLDPTNYYTLGASYDFGDFTLYGAYQYVSHGTRMPGYNYIHIDKRPVLLQQLQNPQPRELIRMQLPSPLRLRCGAVQQCFS